MTLYQTHEMLISYGFDCFKTNICWYYKLNSYFDGKECIFLFPVENGITFSDFVVYRNKDDSFSITFKNAFFRSGIEEIDEYFLKMKIEEYLLKYKNTLVELQKLELENEFS